MKSIRKIFGSFRFSFLPPLMIYLAAGVSGLTSIVGLFFVKEYLDLSAARYIISGGRKENLKDPKILLIDFILMFKIIFFQVILNKINLI